MMSITSMKDFLVGALMGACVLAAVLIVADANLSVYHSDAVASEHTEDNLIYEIDKLKWMYESNIYGPDFLRVQEGEYEMCVCHAI